MRRAAEFNQSSLYSKMRMDFDDGAVNALFCWIARKGSGKSGDADALQFWRG